MFMARCGGGVCALFHPSGVSPKFDEGQMQAPIRLRSGQAFDSPPPTSTPKSKSALWGPRKALGAPFAQDDNCCFDLNSRDRTLAAKTKTSRGWAPGVHDLSSFLGWILRGLKPPPTADGRRPVYSDLGFAPHRRRPAHRDEAADPEGSPTGHSFSRFED